MLVIGFENSSTCENLEHKLTFTFNLGTATAVEVFQAELIRGITPQEKI